MSNSADHLLFHVRQVLKWPPFAKGAKSQVPHTEPLQKLTDLQRILWIKMGKVCWNMVSSGHYYYLILFCGKWNAFLVNKAAFSYFAVGASMGLHRPVTSFRSSSRLFFTITWGYFGLETHYQCDLDLPDQRFHPNSYQNCVDAVKTKRTTSRISGKYNNAVHNRPRPTYRKLSRHLDVEIIKIHGSSGTA